MLNTSWFLHYLCRVSSTVTHLALINYWEGKIWAFPLKLGETSSYSIHDLRLINSVSWASFLIVWEKMSLNKVLCLIHLGLIYHSATDRLKRKMVVNGHQSCSRYLISMINVKLLLSKAHYRDRVRRRELWLAVRLLKLQMRHISNAAHSKKRRYLTHVVEVCSIFAIELVKRQLVIILRRENKVASVQCLCLCVDILYIFMCVCSMCQIKIQWHLQRIVCQPFLLQWLPLTR